MAASLARVTFAASKALRELSDHQLGPQQVGQDLLVVADAARSAGRMV